jgi:hypothetical protein
MKVLNDEQQTELREFLEGIQVDYLPPAKETILNYWIQELKPKRAKRKNKVDNV